MLRIVFYLGLCTLCAFVSVAYGSRREAPAPIEVPPALRQKLKSFEASALVYLSDLGRFLVAIDDTDENDRPMLFLMDAGGRVDESEVEVKGIKKLADVESISQEGAALFLLSSMSVDKDGRERKERNQFVRARRSGRQIEASDSVELRPLLLNALERSGDPLLAGMRKRFKDELDIEGHFVRGGELFVGLKNPQPRPGVGLVLNLGRVDRLFREQEIESLEIWQTIDFRSRPFADEQRISDLVPMDGDQVLVSSTAKSGGGALWLLNPAEGSLRVIQHFSRYRPEGVALMPFAPGGIAVFDQKSDPALFLKFDPGR